MTKKPLYDSIIFSPHPDDAVFSLGATLLAGFLGKVKVINIFSTSRYTIHAMGDKASVTAKRIEEDRKAMEYLNVDVIYWNYPDSSLRPQYKDEDHYLDPGNNPEDDVCYQHVYSSIKNEFIENNGTFFFAPLGLGTHIDHTIIACACSSVQNTAIAYYEDGSYFTGNPADARRFADILQLTDVLSIDPGNLNKKMELVNFYSSQLNTEIYSSLKEAYIQSSGERIWFAKKKGVRFPLLYF